MDTSRTEILVGKEGIEKLSKSSVAVFGLGGVGAYALEALVRAGIGCLYIFDYDRVSPSNVNRQLIALNSTIGHEKIMVVQQRITDINPMTKVHANNQHLTNETIRSLPFSEFGFAIDAIDELGPKTYLIKELIINNITFVSSMGAGSKLNPLNIKVADISKTSHCPLARAIRARLKKEGITTGVRCVYSEENLRTVVPQDEAESLKAFIQGSISYVPGIFGLTAAGIIIQDILSQEH